MRRAGLASDATKAQLAELVVLVGPVLPITNDATADAVDLSRAHGLTFYDAAWAAVARRRNAILVSADRQLLDANLALGADDVCSRLLLS